MNLGKKDYTFNFNSFEMKETIISISIVTITSGKNKFIAILDSEGTCWKLIINIYDESKKEEISEIKSYVKISSIIRYKKLLYLIDIDGSVWIFDNKSDSLQKYEDLCNVKNIFINCNYSFILFKNGKILQKKFYAYKFKKTTTNFLDISDFTELCSMSRVISIAGTTDDALFLLDDGIVFEYNIVKKTYSFVAADIQKIGSKAYLDNKGQLFNMSNKRIDSQHEIIDFGEWEFRLLTWNANFELHQLYYEKLQLLESGLPQIHYIPNKSARK